LAAVLLIGVAFVLAACLERQIRFSGMLLELLGLLIVVIGLRDTRRAFDDQPTTWESIKLWWAGRPRFGPQHDVVAVAAGSLGLAGGSVRARVSPGPNTPLERRVVLLEQQYANLYDEVGKLGEEAKRTADEFSKALDMERAERQQADQNTKDQLKNAVAEGIPLERVGGISIATGMVAATASAELVSLFGAGPCS